MRRLIRTSAAGKCFPMPKLGSKLDFCYQSPSCVVSISVNWVITVSSIWVTAYTLTFMNSNTYINTIVTVLSQIGLPKKKKKNLS